MRARLLFATFVVVPLTLRCGAEEDVERAPRPPLAVAVGPDIPSWAHDTWTRFDGDLRRVTVDPDGTVVDELSGGDYGGESCGKARVEDGRIVVVSDDPSRRTLLVIVRDADDAMFVSRPLPKVGAPRAYERGARCGRDVGGCGGFGHVEPCTSDERARIQQKLDGCRAGRGAADAGADAGAGADARPPNDG